MGHGTYFTGPGADTLTCRLAIELHQSLTIPLPLPGYHEHELFAGTAHRGGHPTRRRLAAHGLFQVRVHQVDQVFGQFGRNLLLGPIRKMEADVRLEDFTHKRVDAATDG